MDVSGCSNDGGFRYRRGRGACAGVPPCPARVRSRRVARRVNAQVAENVAIRRRLQSACKRIRDAAQGLYSPPCARFDALRRDLAPPYPHVYGGAHFAAPHGRDAPHAADHRRRRRRERKMWRSRTPKYPSADRQRARGRRCERNRDVYRHAPVATDTSGRVCDWRARRRREAVPESTVAVRVSTHDTSIATTTTLCVRKFIFFRFFKLFADREARF